MDLVRGGQSLPKHDVVIPTEELAAFCRKHHIQKLALFGSVLRDDFGELSDIDVLVEFDPDHVPGLAFFAMESELGAILGRPVDLNTPEFLNSRFRMHVLAEANVLYDVA